MNLAEISLGGFMSHANTRITLPRTGIVLVLGENGSGKSSLIEAVSVAGWGSTLRGTDPWQSSAAKSWAGLETVEHLSVLRTRTKTTKLTWSVNGEARKFETTTKAQDALENDVLGPWDVWRRTCVFSSRDPSHFTLATDSERKRLLEQVLGLDRFDTASERCRADLRLVEKEVARIKIELASTIARRDSATVRIADFTRTIDSLPVISATSTDATTAERFESLVRAADIDIRAAEIEIRKADAAGGEEAAVARQITATLARLRAATCPTCTQPIPAEMRSRLVLEADTATEKSRCAHEAASEAASGTRSALTELRTERDTLAKKAFGARARVAQIAQSLRLQGALIQQRQDALDAREAASATAEGHAVALSEAEKGHALLQACDQVLSLRGVRAAVLGEALSGIEAVANDWLERIASRDLRLKLRPYETHKKGTTSEVIAMEVVGAGGGYGYLASSSGERRRIDIAIMLALAEIAAAAYGLGPGTLYFDEVLDALDDDGVERAASALEALGRERLVIVISHSKALAAALRVSKVIRVIAGVAA